MPQPIIYLLAVFILTTEGHLVGSALADGALGARATSLMEYDRRVATDGTGTYLPPYINGHSGNSRRQAEPEALNGPSKKEPRLDVPQIVPQRQGSVNDAPADGGGHNVTHSGEEVMETQSTKCHISTEDLVATAEATVTRVVKGLVTSDDLTKHMGDMMGVMTDRLSELKDAIFKLESRIDEYNEALMRGKYQQMETLVPHCDNPAKNTLSDSAVNPKITEQENPKVDSRVNGLDAAAKDPSVRDPEVIKYNSSIHMESPLNGDSKKVFTYFWRIPQMAYKLTEWNPRRSFRSESFYIYPGGYRLYLRSYPREGEANFYVHVGITKGDFDDLLKWPFTLKMRVSILDQTRNTRMFEDITSRVWDPTQLCSSFNWQRPTKGDNYECVGLGFPHDVLYQRWYISADSLIIKLSVYLDS